MTEQIILDGKKSDLDSETVYKCMKQYHRIHIDSMKEFITEEKIFVMDLKSVYNDFGISGNAKEDIYPMLQSLYGRVVFDDTLEAIEQLKKKFNLAIGSTTDTLPLQENLLINHLEIKDIYTSEMLKVYKPRPEFYLEIIKKQGWNIEETVYIGDSYIDDIYGPKEIGMKAILIDRKEQYKEKMFLFKPDAIIKSLLELDIAISKINEGY